MVLKALHALPKGGLTKTLRIMKITAIILLSACLTASANGHGQKVTLSEKNARLERVFTSIKQQTGYEFLYTDEMLLKAEPITIDLKSVELQEALSMVFKNQPLTYSIIERTVVVKPKAIETIKEELPLPPITVRGRVVNETGEPVVVSVVVKGTQNGTVTNSDGYFELKNVEEGATLVISGVSLEKAVEIRVNGKTEIGNINVTTKVNEGENVVLNAGYYTTTDKLRTGSISRVTSKDIEKSPVTNVLAAISGRVPGLLILQNSGVPGGAFTVQLRGRNSIDNSNNPLYVIDGVPYASQTLGSINGTLQSGNPLNFINPSDIASVEVLKDADATAIYGSRGANGVILITTKKGKAGTVRVDINMYTGFGKVTRTMDLMNTQEYLQMRREAFKNDNVIPTVSNARDLLFWDTTRYTDWTKVLIGNTAHYHDIQGSISGGSENVQYLLGGGYHRESSVYAKGPGTGPDQKASVHFSINAASPNRKLKINLSNSFVSNKNNVTPNSLESLTIGLAPNAPALFNTDGTLNWAPMTAGAVGTWTNPLSTLQFRYKGNTMNLVSNANLSYTFLKELELNVALGYNNLRTDEITTLPTTAFDPGLNRTSGTASYNSSNLKSWIIEPKLNYSFSFGKSSLTALVGGTFNQVSSDRQSFNGSGYASDALLENMQAASSLSVSAFLKSNYKYVAAYGRINYNFNDKYILNLTARRDGSTRFGPENRFANFGAIGTAWLFSNETFIKKGLPFISFGKLRASYGTSGNDGIGDYQYFDLYGTTTYPYQGNQGLYTTRLFNPALAWEVNKKFEAGLELGLFKDALKLSTSFYKNRSGNQLLGVPLSLVTGFSTITENLPALVQNSGVELFVSIRNIRNKNFSWITSANLTIPKNKLISFPGLASSRYATQYLVGQPLSIRRVYPIAGVNDTTGVYQFFNSKGERVYSVSSSTDQNKIINVATEYYGGISNSFQYKGISLDIFVQFVKQFGANLSNVYSSLPGTMANQPRELLNRWQVPGDHKPYQRFTQAASSTAGSVYTNYRTNESGYSDASFIRLKNLSLSYQLPEKINRKLNFQNCRFYIQGQNLFTITDYYGYDPETLGRTLPPLRVLTFGVQVTL